MIDFVALRLYTDHGNGGFELLPKYANLHFDVKYNEVGVLEFEYPRADAKALDLKDQDLIGAVCGLSDGTMIEVEQFVVEGTDDSKVSDGEKMMKIICRSTLGSYMEDSVVYPSNWPVTSPTGHEFINSTVGTIMRTLIQRAKDRGCYPFLIETSFTGSSDSFGASWNALHTQDYATGTTYLQILRDFMELGYVDAWMEGTNLRIVNGGSRGQHIDIGTVELRPTQNVSEMSSTTKSDESISTVLIEGEEGTAVERHRAAFQSTLGRRRERYVQQGGIADAGVLTLLADAELELFARIPTEETLGVANSGLTPFSDFQIGDWVWVRYDSDQAPVERRVRQIAVAVDETGAVSLGLTLNTILYEQDVALQRRMDQYVGKGGTYGSVPNTGIDVTKPAAPYGVAVNSGNYWDPITRTYVGAFVVHWTAPTLNEDGTALDDLSHYEVQFRYVGDLQWHPTVRTSSTETSLGYSPVTPGRTIEVQVRAVDTSDNASVWTDIVQQAIQADVTPPPKPSTPTAQSRLGSIRLYWNGLAFDGGPMPEDFWYASVHIGPNSSFAPTDANEVATLSGSGQVLAGTDLAYNSTHWLRIVAYDVSGNASPASDAVSVTVKALVETDVIGEIINGANIKDGSITASEKVIARTITGGLIQGFAIEAGHIAANAITADKVDAGAITADKISVGARGTSVVPNSYMEDPWIDANGNELSRPALWDTLLVTSGTGPTITGETASPVTGQRSMRVSIPASSGAIIANHGGFFPVAGGEKWYVKAVFRMVTTLESGRGLQVRMHTAELPSEPWGIMDPKVSWFLFEKFGSFAAGATVTVEGTFTVPANHARAGVSVGIGDGSAAATVLIDQFEAYPAGSDANISEIGAGKIRTGFIQAGSRIVAGASLTAARVEMTSSGFYAYNASAQQTFAVDGNTGDVSMWGGLLTTSFGGKRIELGRTGPNDPVDELRMWNDEGLYAPVVCSLRNPSFRPGSAFFSTGFPSSAHHFHGNMDFAGTLMDCYYRTNFGHMFMVSHNNVDWAGFHFKNSDNSNFVRLFASAFLVATSLTKYKENVERLPVDARAELRKNGAHRWKPNKAAILAEPPGHAGEPREVTQKRGGLSTSDRFLLPGTPPVEEPVQEEVGLIADDMPEWMRSATGYSLNSVVAFLWEAVRQVDERVEALEESTKPKKK